MLVQQGSKALGLVILASGERRLGCGAERGRINRGADWRDRYPGRWRGHLRRQIERTHKSPVAADVAIPGTFEQLVTGTVAACDQLTMGRPA
jgi:hypothetical protein